MPLDPGPLLTPREVDPVRSPAPYCFVYRMRRRGERIAPAEIEPPMHGKVLLIDRYGGGETFVVQVIEPGYTMGVVPPELHGAVLVKRKEGVRLFTGEEWHSGHKMAYRQTWLCTPDEATGRGILERMST